MRTLFFIFLSLISYPLYSLEVKGKVVDAVTKEALLFSDVYLSVGGKTLYKEQTDESGLFLFKNVPENEYVLQVNYFGYDPYISPAFKLSGKNADMGIIGLRPLETGLETVEIVASKKQVVYQIDKRIIDGSSNMMAGGGTAVDILENTPSIRVDAEGNVSFRGSQGFLVYIDGKPSLYSGTQALEQVPSSHIQNIEIITSPSARYEAEGDVGIINIVTKKNFGDGWSGMVNLTGSTVWSKGADFLLSYQHGRSRWYIGGNASNRWRESDFEQNKTTVVRDTVTISRSMGPRDGMFYIYSGKAGWQYDMPRTRYNIDFEAGYSGKQRSGDLAYSEEQSLRGVVLIPKQDFVSKDDYDNHETIWSLNLGVEHKFNDDGHKLTAGLYGKYGGNSLEYFESDLYRQNVREHGHRAYEDEYRGTIKANLDYVYPYSKTGKLEAGYQYFMYCEDGDYSMEFWNPETHNFYWDDNIYNTFLFLRGVNSIYAIWGESYKAFDVQLGLRGEHTHQILDSSKEWADRTRNQFELFPSAHVAYNLPGEHRLSLGFSRRTSRPELYYMEPYITYRDYFTAEIGNPDIRPEYIYSYELGYRKSFGSGYSLSATLFHRYRQDKFERLRVPFKAGVTLDSMANVGNDYATGLELSVEAKITRWWNANLNGNLYHYRVENNFRTEGSDESSTNYDISLSNSFDVAKYTRVQLDGNFVGPSVSTQGKVNSFFYVNLGVRQQFFNRRLTGTLSFKDIFGSARYVSDINTPSLKSHTRIKPSYPLITLSVSYTFNNFKIKSEQKKDNYELFEGTNH
ncbi:MAG: TonB-dependent receptor [Bacteroidaceae bacterium]|nr:TonB-dependent receptor [Bacteroidaceae bacterium]